VRLPTVRRSRSPLKADKIGHAAIILMLLWQRNLAMMIMAENKHEHELHIAHENEDEHA
jgi:hypothetical protein